MKLNTFERMTEVARGHANVSDALFSCGEFSSAQIFEHHAELITFLRNEGIDPIRQGVVQ
jgi:hypothetical protein